MTDSAFEPDAMTDRLVHNAYRLELEGQSMRKTLQNHTTKTSDDKDR